jgi:hypothetical protein
MKWAGRQFSSNQKILKKTTLADKQWKVVPPNQSVLTVFSLWKNIFHRNANDDF